MTKRPAIETLLIEEGYTHLKRLGTGEYAGVRNFLMTVGIVVGLDEDGYRVRYCYEREELAVAALDCWDGVTDPGGPWVKKKGTRKDGTHADEINPHIGLESFYDFTRLDDQEA